MDKSMRSSFNNLGGAPVLLLENRACFLIVRNLPLNCLKKNYSQKKQNNHWIFQFQGQPILHMKRGSSSSRSKLKRQKQKQKYHNRWRWYRTINCLYTAINTFIAWNAYNDHSALTVYTVMYHLGHVTVMLYAYIHCYEMCTFNIQQII